MKEELDKKLVKAFICDACGKKCNGTEKKTITTKQLSGVVMCEECSGGNTTERVEEQATRLEKIAEQKSTKTSRGRAAVSGMAATARKLAKPKPKKKK